MKRNTLSISITLQRALKMSARRTRRHEGLHDYRPPWRPKHQEENFHQLFQVTTHSRRSPEPCSTIHHAASTTLRRVRRTLRYAPMCHKKKASDVGLNSYRARTSLAADSSLSQKHITIFQRTRRVRVSKPRPHRRMRSRANSTASLTSMRPSPRGPNPTASRNGIQAESPAPSDKCR